jgi:hypothetical protein
VPLSRFPIAQSNSVLQALQFQEVSICRIRPGGTGVSHNWPNQSYVKRKIIFVLKRPHLNREQVRTYVRKALATILSIWRLHVLPVNWSVGRSVGKIVAGLRQHSHFRLKFKVMLRSTVGRPVYLGVKPPPEAQDQIFLLSDRCEFVDVRRPMWREKGSVFYNCWWSSPAQSFSVPSPARFMIIFYSLKFETP